MPAVIIIHLSGRTAWDHATTPLGRARRTILKTGAAIAALQFVSPFIIKAPRRDAGQDRLHRSRDRHPVRARPERGRGRQIRRRGINKKGGILGRQVELLVEDSANDVGTGVQKTRKLIDRDQVDVIFGDVNSGIAYAIAQVTSEKKVFHIVPGGHTDPITGTDCKWNVFRICNTTTHGRRRRSPATLVKKFGKKWFFITPDYAYGHTLQDAFVKLLKAAAAPTRATCCRSTPPISPPP